MVVSDTSVILLQQISAIADALKCYGWDRTKFAQEAWKPKGRP